MPVHFWEPITSLLNVFAIPNEKEAFFPLRPILSDNCAPSSPSLPVDHEVLDRERGRLQAFYQQQQQHQQPQQQKPSYSHRHSTSRDLDQQFAKLSLKQKEVEHEVVLGQLHICHNCSYAFNHILLTDPLTSPWSDKSSRFPLCDLKKRSSFPCAHLQRGCSPSV